MKRKKTPTSFPSNNPNRPLKEIEMKRFAFLVLFLALTGLTAGCAGGLKYSKGVNALGEKLYLGSAEIESTDAFKNYSRSPKGEADKQRYLFERLKAAEGFEFYHDGSWYNALEAYRGGMWLMSHRYKKGFPTRDFIKQHIERSDAGNLHLVRYPDGSLQIGSYILYNELDLLEEKTA